MKPYRFTVLTLFPDMIRDAVGHSILGRGIGAGVIEVKAIDIRDFTTDRHRTADDEPYGGGPGMVMKVEPVASAISNAKMAQPNSKTLLMSAAGRRFDQSAARRYASYDGGLILVCGHYEGVDERIAEHFADEEVSVGDFVLSGGEIAALTIVDATARLLPGVLGNADSLEAESHETGILEYPQYTRPPVFEGHEVPAVLLSGNHAEIQRHRRMWAEEKTTRNRPDLAENIVKEPSKPTLKLGRPTIPARNGDE